MPIGHELSIPGEALQRLLFPLGVITIDVVKDPRLEDKKRAVDPPFSQLRLLGKLNDFIAIELKLAESGRRPNRGDSRKTSVSAMKLQQSIEIYRCDPVAPCQHEGLVP